MKNSIQAKVNRYLQLDFSDDDSLWISSGYTLRKLIGILGMLLPFLLYALLLINNKIGYPLASISHYYYTHAGSIFVIILSLLAIFLIIYKGKEPVDFYFSLLAGIFALCVVLFPTNNLINSDCTLSNDCVVTTWQDNPFRKNFHYISAGIFLLSLAVMSFFLFTKSKYKAHQRGREKVIRNRIYRTCGVLMVISVLVIFASFIKLMDPDWCHEYSITFWMETMAVECFGFSWLVKGGAFFKDKTDKPLQH